MNRRRTPIFSTIFAVLVVSISAAQPLRAEEPKAATQTFWEVSEDELFDKIYGGWVGMLIGGLEGLPHEFKYRDQPRDSLPEFTFLAKSARSDDDNDIEWLHLWAMDRSETLFLPYEKLAELWKANMNRGVWRANLRARELMDQGLIPPLTGDIRHNEHAWYNLAGQFCVESYGLVAPGMPQLAAALGLHYAKISVSGEPLQAAQFWAAAVSLAFVRRGSMEELLREALAAVDPKSQMGSAILDAFESYRMYPEDWKAARQRIHMRWRIERGWNDNSVTVNGAVVCLALLYGNDDFYQTLRYAMALGYDADCNAATAGTIVGVRTGFRAIAATPQFRMPDRYENRTRPQLPQEIPVSEQARTILRLAGQAVLDQGGRIEERDGNKVYFVPVQAPRNLESLSHVSLKP